MSETAPEQQPAQPVPWDAVIASLRAREWPLVTATYVQEGQVLDSGLRFLLCPYCGAVVPEPTPEWDPRELHIDFHQDVLTALAAL